jgi:hypothetical protein
VGGALVAVILVIALVALASGQSSPRSVAGTPSTPTVARVRSATRRSRLRSAAANGAAAATGATASTGAAAGTGTAVARTKTASPAAATAPATTASSTAGHPQSIAGAARALAALISQGVQSGAIDPQAWQQLAPALAAVLDSWRTGGVGSVQHHLADVAHQIAALEQQGQIASAAAPGLNAALSDLRNALSAASPQAATANGGLPPGSGGSLGPGAAQGQDGSPGQGQGAGAVPPGRGGGLPGHDRHFGSQDGSAQGD